MLVVVGLGNPGAAYRNTRHNAGFMVVDGIAEGKYLPDASFSRKGSRSLGRLFSNKVMFNKTSGPYVSLEGALSNTRFLLVKPTTYMNESGRALADIVRRGIVKEIDELLIVLDDIHLDVGRLRFREKGSSGGQKGLKNIIDILGTDEISRLRIGVGPRPDGDLKEYVLGSFKPDERICFNDALENAARLVGSWIENGVPGITREYSRLSGQQENDR